MIKASSTLDQSIQDRLAAMTLSIQPFDWSEWQLDRLKHLLAKLNNPHHHLPPIIHIAGTNGKGSTVAFCQSILEHAGYQVHCFTSPHLMDITERITLCGKSIAKDHLITLFDYIKPHLGDEKLTFFELMTATAFVAFAAIPADAVILETGLGGRLDATNLVPNPKVTTITPISFDHEHILGSMLEQIALEKAGIFKKGAAVVIAPQFPDIEQLLINKAYEIRCPVDSFDQQWNIQPNDQGGLTYWWHDRAISLPMPGLAGDHQIMNAGVALTSLLAAGCFTLPDEACQKGVAEVHWPGRLMKVHWPSMQHDWSVWLDGAHNQGGAEVIAHFIHQHDDQPWYIIVGHLIQRDVKPFLEPLLSTASLIVTVPVPHKPSHDPIALAHFIQEYGCPAQAYDTLDEAMLFLSTTQKPGNILITGSLYLVGEALQMIAPSLK